MDIKSAVSDIRSGITSLGQRITDSLYSINIAEKGELCGNPAENNNKTFYLYIMNIGSSMADVMDYGYMIEKCRHSIFDENKEKPCTIYAGEKLVVPMDTVKLVDDMQYCGAKRLTSPIYWYVNVNGHIIRKQSKFRYSDVIYSK